MRKIRIQLYHRFTLGASLGVYLFLSISCGSESMSFKENGQGTLGNGDTILGQKIPDNLSQDVHDVDIIVTDDDQASVQPGNTNSDNSARDESIEANDSTTTGSSQGAKSRNALTESNTSSNSGNDDTSDQSSGNQGDDDQVADNSDDSDETTGKNTKDTDTTGDEGSDEDDAGLAICGDYMDGDLVKINGNKNSVFLNDGDSAFLRVTGNQNTLTYNLSSDSQLSAGLCLFVSGNRQNVVVSVNGLQLSDLIVVVRGNKNTVTVQLGADAQIINFVEDLNGNQPTLILQ